MKKTIIALAAILALSPLFAFQDSTLEGRNEYGGSTVQRVYDASDEEYQSVDRMLSYFDADKGLRRRVYFHNENIRGNIGIETQEELYQPGGGLPEYLVNYTAQNAAAKGVSSVRETIDERENIVKAEYYRGDALIQTDPSEEEEYRFPFYRLAYVEKALLATPKGSMEKVDCAINQRYVSIRAVVGCAGKQAALDDVETRGLDWWCAQMKAEKIRSRYASKVLVTDDGTEHWVLIQDELLPQLSDGGDFLMNFFTCRAEGKALLICVSLARK
jgi:hypothetical protein